MLTSPLPKRLKEARQAMGLSQKSLGIKAGIDEFSASTRMNQYETGKYSPDYLSLKNIAAVLNVPTAYFYAENDQLAQMIKLFNTLKKSDRTLLLKQLQK